jgi:phage virion morphogenesis protein
MTGTTLRIEFEPGRLMTAVKMLRAAIREPTPLMRVIGTGLLRNTQDRFEEERAPSGAPWEPLNAWYQTFKRGPGILRAAGMRGGLQGSLIMDVEGDAVRIGSNKIYAAVHQFGATIRPKNPDGLLVIRTGKGGRGQVMGKAKQVTIPARPYLGLSARDEETILDATETYLDLAITRIR